MNRSISGTNRSTFFNLHNMHTTNKLQYISIKNP
jgi:hypothetical protein